MAETYDEQQEREWQEAAARITEKQLTSARDITLRVLDGDSRQLDGATLAGVVQAMATNLATIRRKR